MYHDDRDDAMPITPNFELEGVQEKPKKIIRGIPCFDDSEFFYSELSRGETLSLSRLAATLGWKNAVFALKNKFVRRYIIDPRRTLFLSVLDISQGERILDVGGGWGNISARIAKLFPTTKVYTLDKTIERLLFANEIRSQENLKNMYLIQGDISDSPFERGFFDIVILMGVFEYLGATEQHRNPEEIQMDILKSICEIMKPGGRLVIGIENRVGWSSLGGALDHSGLRYTSLMPRKIANYYCKIRGKGAYRTYTYSRRGYVKLLTNAGFSSQTIFVAHPDYWFPSSICSPDALRDVAKRRFVKHLPSRLAACFANSFLIVARKEP